MPLEIRDPFAPPETYTIGIGSQDNPEPSFMEGVEAALRYENLIGAYLARASRDLETEELHRVDPKYNPFKEDLKGYEGFLDRFERSYNPKMTAAIKADIDREQQDNQTLESMGMVGYALRMGAAIADPTILIPGGAIVRSGKVGYSVGKSALNVGMAAGVATGLQEAGLQNLQQTRTPGESAVAISGSILLGALIGSAGAKFLTKAEWTKFSDALEGDLAADVKNPGEIAETIVNRMQSVGAASVDELNLDDLGVGGPRAAQAVARATASLKINPGVELMHSPSKEVRKSFGEMMDNAIYTKMNMEGKTLGPDIENMVKIYQRGALAEWVKMVRGGLFSGGLYRDARKAGFEGTFNDFMTRVSKAARRGDIDELGDEYVTRAAREAREKIFDPLLKQAQEARLLPEDIKVTTAASYLHRLWNRQKLIGEENRFREIAGEYFRKALADIPEGERPGFVSQADMDDHIEEVVTSVFNNLTGRGDGEVPEWIVPVKRGPLKERTFGIADELVEDFLENDMELVLRRYTRIMPAEIELTKRFGSADMKDTIKRIRNEYADLRKGITDPAKLKKLTQRENRDIRIISDFRDMLRGTYRQAEESSEWGILTRTALTWNYIRLLGGVVLSSASDLTRMVGVHGVRATMREALPVLVSNLQSVKIARQDARELGAVTETVLQSRLATLADLQDPYRYGSTWERTLSNASGIFSRATGLAWWNDTMKTVASVMTQNRLAKTVLNWDGARKQDRAYAALLGIDENIARDLAKQIRTHGIKEKGIWGANASKWDDDYARRVWAAALNKDVDRTIVTKGQADQPLWTKSNWGRLIMQFKSFGMASHQKVLISGLQNDQHRLAEMIALATPLGMMVSWLKFVERGDQDNADRLLDNPGLWIANGLDRTGIASIPFEFSNTAEKLGLPGFVSAAQAIAQDEDRGGSVSRYASRNKLGAVAGPSAGILRDFFTVGEQLAAGEFKQSGANAILRQVPGGTLPGARTGLNMYVRPKLQEALE